MYLNIFIPTPILNKILRSWTHIKGKKECQYIYRLRIIKYSKHFALSGWLIRYTDTNIASFFFVLVYVHIELYYSSYESPRVSVWPIGVLILGLND